MIGAPPRHAKSTLSTILYPVHRLERDPDFRIVVGSHNKDKGADFGRKARKIAEERIPSLDHRRQLATDWQTIEGGVYRGVGRGNPPMGEGFHLAIIDDPVGSWSDATSRAIREQTWEWYLDILTRLEPGGAVIMPMHRWHEDDIAGRALAAEDGAEWTVVNLTAIAEPNDCLGREVGEALWPERWPLSELEPRIRAQTPSRREALYFGRPTLPEGHVLPVQKIQPIRFADVPENLKRAIAWDLAGTEAARADYSVGHLAAGPDPQGNVYLGLEIIRGQWEVSDRNRKMREAAERHGADVRIRIPRDHKGDVGKEIVSNLKRLLTGYTVRDIRPDGPKDGARAEPLATAMGNRQIFLVEDTPWPEYYDRGQRVQDMKTARAIYKEELRGFGLTARNDDQVDTTCDVYAELTRPTSSVFI